MATSVMPKLLIGSGSCIFFLSSSMPSCSFAAAAKNQKYYILMCTRFPAILRVDDYVEGILEKRAPFRAGHLGLAKVCVPDGA